MLTYKIVKLARAMCEHEGWSPLNNPASKSGGPSVAYRNHNPGNLRSSVFALSIRDGFAVFLNDDIGFFSMVYDLWCKCTNRTNTKLTPDSNIRDLISVWCPTGQDSINNYVKYVCAVTGYTETMLLKTLVD